MTAITRRSALFAAAAATVYAAVRTSSALAQAPGPFSPGESLERHAFPLSTVSR